MRRQASRREPRPAEPPNLTYPAEAARYRRPFIRPRIAHESCSRCFVSRASVSASFSASTRAEATPSVTRRISSAGWGSLELLTPLAHLVGARADEIALGVR